MIAFEKLWETMKKQQVTIRIAGQIWHESRHVQRLQADMPVSTHTLNKLCATFQCRLEEIAEYVPDER